MRKMKVLALCCMLAAGMSILTACGDGTKESTTGREQNRTETNNTGTNNTETNNAGADNTDVNNAGTDNTDVNNTGTNKTEKKIKVPIMWEPTIREPSIQRM